MEYYLVIKRNKVLINAKIWMNLENNLSERSQSQKVTENRLVVVREQEELGVITHGYGVSLVKAVVLPVVVHGCESWTIKKAEHRRINAFELCCWSRLLRVPWTARRSNQSILKEISPGVHWKDWCWSWNSSTLATWCKELTHWKRPWCWERLKAGGEGNNRGRDGWMASSTQWTWVWVNSGSWWWTERPGWLLSTGSLSWTRLSDWTELNGVSFRGVENYLKLDSGDGCTTLWIY